MAPSFFDTPEEAAMVGFPPKYCRVVASCVHGDDAYVLIDTGSDGRTYLYGVNCSRSDGRWSETSSSNRAGWSQAGPDPDLGTLVAWDEAPPEADAARVSFSDDVQEVEVRNGVYLAAWWRIPCPSPVSFPRVDSFRISGKWIRA